MPTPAADPLLAQYRRDGFVLIPDVISRAHTDALLARMEDYALKRRPAPPGFNTQIEPRVERGEIKADPKQPMQRYRKINGPVPGDDLLTNLVLEPRILGPMKMIMGPDIKLLRADFLMKPPGVGSAKGAHQDSPYWPFQPYDLASCWIAFDDATLTNGCMQVIPGSHTWGAMPHVNVTDDFVVPEDKYDRSKLAPVEMKAGTGLIFHSLLMHYTAPNTSDHWRRAITISYIPGWCRYTGPAPKPDYFRVCGNDVAGGV